MVVVVVFVVVDGVNVDNVGAVVAGGSDFGCGGDCLKPLDPGL